MSDNKLLASSQGDLEVTSTGTIVSVERRCTSPLIGGVLTSDGSVKLIGGDIVKLKIRGEVK